MFSRTFSRRHLYKTTVQVVILSLVFAGHAPLLAAARPSEAPPQDEGLAFQEPSVFAGNDQPTLAGHNPPLGPQPAAGQRPIAPPQGVPGTANLPIDAGSFSVTVVVSTSQGEGIHQDPTISADGNRVAFWSTGDLFEGPGPGHVVINEIVAYQTVILIELYNGTASPVDMTGWQVTEYNDANLVEMVFVFPPYVLPAGAYVRLYNYSGTYQGTGYFYTNHDYVYGDGINEGGAVALTSGAIGVDFVRWGTSTINPPLGTGWTGTNPLAPVYYYPVYNVLGRDKVGSDTDKASDWCLQAFYTAGQPNKGCHNPDGNIEAFWAEINSPTDSDYTQISFSNGSILGGFNLKPSISGDGSRIAFFSDRDLLGTNADENFEIFAYDIATKKLLQLTDSSRGANILPSINADGTRIAFVSDRDLAAASGGDNSDGNLEIFRAEVDYASEQVTFVQVTDTSGATINDQPSINADGTRIAFVSDRDGNYEIYHIVVGSASALQVTNTSGGVINEQPSISGNGSRVAYTQVSGLTSHVYWAELNPVVTHVQVSTGGSINERPAMNRQGDRIAFFSDYDVMLYYTAFASPPVVVAKVPTDTLLSGPAIATGSDYAQTYVAFSTGGSVYRVFCPLYDLSLAKSYKPALVEPGSAITYTLFYINAGLNPAYNVVITDTVPAELNSVNCVGGSLAGGVCTWGPTTLASGTQATVTVTALVNTGLTAGYRFTNTAGITSTTPEANAANNVSHVVVTVANAPPNAVDDSGPAYQTNEDTTLNVPFADRVLANDTDPNGDPLSASLATYPAHGTLTLWPTGTFTYDPAQDYFGVDTFAYIATDTGGLTDTATVTITVVAVNDAPVLDLNGGNDPGFDFGSTFTEDGGPVLIVDGDLSLTDVDSTVMASALITLTNRPNGISETLSVTTVAGISASYNGATGVLSLSGSDTIANYQQVLRTVAYDNGSDDPSSANRIVQFVVFDSLGAPSAVRTSTVTVIPVNDAPQASDVTRVINEGSSVSIPVVPTYVYDPDSPVLTVTLATLPISGTATVFGGTTVVYTPTAVFTLGNDVFTYVVSDGLATDTGTITITVNDRPQATDDVTSTLEGQPLTIYVLSNDSDVYPNGTITVTSASDPPNGTTVVNPAYVFYTPDVDYYGPDSFVYVISDGYMTNTATVNVTVIPVNDPPAATMGTYHAVTEDAGQQVVANWIQGLIPGPANEYGQVVTLTLSYAIVSGPPNLFLEPPTVTTHYNAFSYPQTSVLTYTPRADLYGQAVVTVTLQDDGGTLNGGIDASSPVTFAIVISSVNDAPTFAGGGDQAILEDAGPQTVPGWATGISAGPPNELLQTLNFVVTADNPSLFSAQPDVDETTGDLTYTPASDRYGSTVVTVTLYDNGGTANGGVDTSVPVTFTISIASINDAPTFSPGGSVTWLVNQPYNQSWATNILPGGWQEGTQNLWFTVTNDNPALFSVPPTLTAPTAPWPGVSNLQFTPQGSVLGSATVTATLRDSGGTANGGVDASPPVVFTVNVIQPPLSVTIGDPSTGATDTIYTFTATVAPPATSLPLTYTWQATGQTTVVHAGAGSLVDTVTYSWSTTGTYTVTVTVDNVLGLAPVVTYVVLDIAEASQVSTSTVTVDGNTTEWGSRIAYSIAKCNSPLCSSPPTSGDLSANFGVLWDTNNLYVMVVVTDNSRRMANPAPIYDDDSVELFLDMNHSAGTAYGAGDYHYIFGRNGAAITETVHYITSTVTWQVAERGPSTGYRVEIQIPWTALGVTAPLPATGMIFGLDVAVNDDDNGGARDDQLIWHSPDALTTQYPNRLGDCRLGP